MSTAILVTGGTGTLGRKVVPRLLATGREIRVLSRRQPPGQESEAPTDGPAPRWFVGDLRSGAGLAAALEGVGTVLHCATAPRGDAEAAAHLRIAAGRAGGPHVVYPSIVGVDRIEYRYYRDKRAVERLLEDGDLPWTVLRSTQFHELIDHGMRRVSRIPLLMPVPSGTSFQPIAADEVADRLVELCTGSPARRVPDLGGPEVLEAADLARAWLAATGRRRRPVSVRLPGKVFLGYRSGAHLVPDRALGRQTFAQYLAVAHAKPPAAPKPGKGAPEPSAAETDKASGKASGKAAEEKAAEKPDSDPQAAATADVPAGEKAGDSTESAEAPRELAAGSPAEDPAAGAAPSTERSLPSVAQPRPPEARLPDRVEDIADKRR